MHICPTNGFKSSAVLRIDAASVRHWTHSRKINDEDHLPEKSVARHHEARSGRCAFSGSSNEVCNRALMLSGIARLPPIQGCASVLFSSAAIRRHFATSSATRSAIRLDTGGERAGVTVGASLLSSLSVADDIAALPTVVPRESDGLSLAIPNRFYGEAVLLPAMITYLMMMRYVIMIQILAHSIRLSSTKTKNGCHVGMIWNRWTCASCCVIVSPYGIHDAAMIFSAHRGLSTQLVRDVHIISQAALLMPCHADVKYTIVFVQIHAPMHVRAHH